MISNAFENRLQKMFAHYSKWARRQGITCYRTYDDDMPEFPFSIDIYENHAYISEYHRKHTLTPEAHTEWLDECMAAVSKVLGIPIENIHQKRRQQQKGSEQYERINETNNRFLANENGLQFWVNLDDYLDTGLFLDHRNTRQTVREQAENKRVLNLFAYTGAFSVYAAAGGAKQVTTIDMSKTYLTWALDNLKINGFLGRSYTFIQADVLQWLPQAPSNSYDIIVIDPPTFSNSKRMDGILDTQRDHVMMLEHCLRLLAPNGQIWFSTNFRKFRLDTALIPSSSIKLVSNQLIPNDFRDRKIHQCWLIQK